MSKWAVEARLFPNGMVVVRIRQAFEGEENLPSGYERIEGCCDIWTDVFNTREEAEDFARQYKRS